MSIVRQGLNTFITCDLDFLPPGLESKKDPGCLGPSGLISGPDLGLDQAFLDQHRSGIDDILVQRRCLRGEIERDGNQLGEIHNGNWPVDIHLELSGVKVHMAQGAGNNNRLSSLVYGVLDQRSAEVDYDIRPG